MAPGLPNLVVDRLRFKQVLLNLCSNAIKFTPPGGNVHVSADQAEDGSFALSVRDTGIGMRRNRFRVALEPFRQVASPFARNVEGTGLGLALVKSLIECHDGRLEIESALNKGTTVRLVLPPDRTVAPPDGVVRLGPQAAKRSGRKLSRIFQTEQRRVIVVREQLAEARPAHHRLQRLFRRILGHMVFQLVQEAGLGRADGWRVRPAPCGYGRPAAPGSSGRGRRFPCAHSVRRRRSACPYG